MFRIGTGFDVHALVEGRPLIVGGISIPHERGLLGHSDADVLLHAMMSALLGALALGDLGTHFPDTDPAYQGASSLQLLKVVYEKIRQERYELVNLDTTILAQQPKFKPYIPVMQQTIAQALKVAPSQISIKATTTEKLGFIGREEGIAAEAVVLLQSKR